MKIVSIVNQKGGVGKTTTAVNLAAGLAQMGKRTLLIDLDPQANATFTYCTNPEISPTIYDVLIEELPVNQAIISTTEGLDLIPSSIDLAGAEIELITEIGGQVKLRNQLQLAQLDYDYLVIDAPPSLGLLTINALTVADGFIVPVGVSVYALKGLQRLQQTIAKVRQVFNPNLEMMGVLCTLADHTNVARDVQTQLQNHFQERVFNTAIPKNVAVEEAHSHRQSCLAYDPKSKGALAYLKFTEEVLERE